MWKNSDKEDKESLFQQS